MEEINILKELNYLELDFLNWSSYQTEFLNKECHYGGQKLFPHTWECAPDRRHMGIHRQIHIAEGFIKQLEKDNPWN